MNLPDTILQQLAKQIEGELFFDKKMRVLYATDASVYKEYPLAVCYPKNENDIAKLIAFAHQHKTSLIPRTAGTSLGGQVVGNGIVVDVSKYFTDIIEVNKDEHFCIVQPGVIRDELNRFLKPYGLLFGPETSTANRAMVGGMVGNNSCGANSIVYGSTRNHLLELEGFLSNGEKIKINALGDDAYATKLTSSTLEGNIYRFLHEKLSDKNIQKEITTNYPQASIHRRNTGYALDSLLNQKPFNENGNDFNL